MNVSVMDSAWTRQRGETKDHQAWSIDARSPWFTTVPFTWTEKEKYNKIFYKSVRCSFSLCVSVCAVCVYPQADLSQPKILFLSHKIWTFETDKRKMKGPM